MLKKKDSSIPNFSSEALLEENRLLREKIADMEKEKLVQKECKEVLSKAIKLGFWEWDEINNRPADMSEEFAAIMGVELEQLHRIYQSEDDLYPFIHQDDLAFYKEQVLMQTMEKNKQGQAYTFDYRIIRPDGEVRHLRELEYGVVEENGVPIKSYGAVQDITEHQEALINLKAGEELFSSLFSHLPMGVEEQDYSSVKKVIDKLREDGVEDIKTYLENHSELLREMVKGTKITRVNQALVDIHGAESKEQFCEFDEDVDDWWDEEWVRFFISEFMGLLDSGNTHHAEVTDTRADGSVFEVRLISRIVGGYEDSWERVITVCEDITERKQSELDLVAAKADAENANQAKSQFLSRMSHELRTPLNAIMGFSQLFESSDRLGLEEQMNASKIFQAGAHLLSLVDEILDLSRIETGEFELSLAPVSLREMITESVDWVEKLGQAQQLTIEFEPEEFRDRYATADALRLKQVLLNLLSNAVKYNRAGGRVRIHCEPTVNQHIRIGIGDTGMGIPEALMGDLFKPFNRLGAESSDIEGTGIGLVITQKLVTMMAGRLQVDSIVGEGSTFWVELPMAESPGLVEVAPSAQQPALAKPVGADRDEGDIRILVAEDTPLNRDLLEAQLEVLGYQADYAENGAEALELWRQSEYHMLLTDIRMPVMDGFELIKNIRANDNPAANTFPIIAVTANAMEQDISDCFDAGASDVLTKPVKLGNLREKMNKWAPKHN